MVGEQAFPGYEAEADFYDHAWSELVEDIAFYEERLERPGPVLDLMCGTGRVGFALARAGWTVEGVDSSSAMLRVARGKARSLPTRFQRRVRFHHGDLARFRIRGVFDSAIIPANSYPLILDRKERVRALRNVRRHLKSSGKLLIHIDTPRSYEPARVGAPCVQLVRLQRGRGWYVRSLVESFLGQDVVRGVSTHVLFDRAGRISKLSTTETRTRVLRIADVIAELREAGFSRSTSFGDFHGGKVTGRSRFAVIEAVA